MVLTFIENPGCYNRICGRFWIFKRNMIIFSSIHTFLHECVRIIQRLYNHLLQHYLSFLITLYIIVQFYDRGWSQIFLLLFNSLFVLQFLYPKSNPISLCQIIIEKHNVRYVLYIHKHQGEFANLFSRISRKYLKSKV